MTAFIIGAVIGFCLSMTPPIILSFFVPTDDLIDWIGRAPYSVIGWFQLILTLAGGFVGWLV